MNSRVNDVDFGAVVIKAIENKVLYKQTCGQYVDNITLAPFYACPIGAKRR